VAIGRRIACTISKTELERAKRDPGGQCSTSFEPVLTELEGVSVKRDPSLVEDIDFAWCLSSKKQNWTALQPWSVISSGGMGGTAGSYTIHSTLGQPVAGSGAAGDYSFTSGFWTEVFEFIEEFFNYLPLIVK
jgi:hypothetical protein